MPSMESKSVVEFESETGVQSREHVDRSKSMCRAMVATPLYPPGFKKARATGLGPRFRNSQAIEKQQKRSFNLAQCVFEVDTKYIPIKVIGRGSYGVVCSAHNLETGEKVAIKKVANVFENPQHARQMLREIRLLRNLVHENIIKVKDIIRPDSKHTFQDVYLVYDLMDTDMHQIIGTPQALSEEHVRYFMIQLLRGLKYVHSANVLHRDLKPDNILLNANCDLKICDFGLARTRGCEGEFMTNYMVTRWYRAPELLLSGFDYSNAIDMWSVGCIFAELLGRKALFPGKDSICQLQLIFNVIGTPEESDLDFSMTAKTQRYLRSLPFRPRASFSSLFPDASFAALSLLERMLVFDPTKRISVSEALEHPFLYVATDNSAESSTPTIDVKEEDDLPEDSLRALVWNEILLYHPDSQAKIQKKFVD